MPGSGRESFDIEFAASIWSDAANWPVPTYSASTVTAAILAPEISCTFPRRLPLVFCATNVAAKKAGQIGVAKILVRKKHILFGPEQIYLDLRIGRCCCSRSLN